MNKTRLRLLTIVLPILYWILSIASLGFIFQWENFLPGLLISTLTISVGVFVFSNWVFLIVTANEKETEARANQLAALNQALISLNSELELTQVLMQVVRISCELVHAKAGALGIWNEEFSAFDQLIPFNIPEEKYPIFYRSLSSNAITEKLTEDGVFVCVQCSKRGSGELLEELNIFSSLAVPVLSKGELIANLFVFDKSDDQQAIIETGFDYYDQELIEMFATQSAIAIENARLYRETQDLAVLEERERFGMDLHDGIIQSIYGVGLNLEHMHRFVDIDPELAKETINKAVVALNDVISDLRNYIMDLQPERFQGRDLNEGIQELVRSLEANTFMTVNYDIMGWEEGVLDQEITEEVLHIVLEAMTNIRKHARARMVEIFVAVQPDELIVSIEDDGIGFELEQHQNEEGHGINNIRERAALIGAELLIQRRRGGGTIVLMECPINQ